MMEAISTTHDQYHMPSEYERIRVDGIGLHFAMDKGYMLPSG